MSRGATKRAPMLVAALFALGGCGFAVKHPAVAAGITGAVIGFSSCEMGGVELKTCALVGGIAGGGLALIAFVATLIAETNDKAAVDQPVPSRRRPRIVPLPAPPVDAGVAIDAPIDAPLADAAVDGANMMVP